MIEDLVGYLAPSDGESCCQLRADALALFRRVFLALELVDYDVRALDDVVFIGRHGLVKLLYAYCKTKVY